MQLKEQRQSTNVGASADIRSRHLPQASSLTATPYCSEYQLLSYFSCLSDARCRPRQRSPCSDSLRAGRSGDQIPVGKRFSASVQICPGVHPASYTKGTQFFPRVKWPGRGVDHPPPSSAEVKERGEIYFYFRLGLCGLFWREIYFISRSLFRVLILFSVHHATHFTTL